MRPHPDDPLTPREHEVMALVARGASDKQIAASLAIEPSTVGQIVHNACVRLGAPNRTAAAVCYAVRYWPLSAEDATPARKPLSPQECRVLALISAGLGDQQIAAWLSVSASTVKQHLLSARRKLGVDNRTAAAVQYYRQARLLTYMKKTGGEEAE